MSCTPEITISNVNVKCPKCEKPMDLTFNDDPTRPFYSTIVTARCISCYEAQPTNKKAKVKSQFIRIGLGNGVESALRNLLTVIAKDK